MATITLTIPSDQVTRVTNALCASAGVEATAANAKAVAATLIKNAVINYENMQRTVLSETEVFVT